MEAEAKERGFGRRNSSDDKVFMDKHFHAPETIDGVVVANLPAKVKEETAFSQYERSTTEFTSIVSPHRTEVSALGAGFGAMPDKRLGFLRPRKTLQPYSGGASSIAPKFDENGMPVDDTLSRDQQMKKRMEYLRSIEGTTMSPREHFLLADLDFEKDAVLFGNTREEFEKNVLKLRNVIVAFQKWERTDNFYYYGTILLKIMVLWVLIECVQQYYDLRLFEGNYEVFAEIMESEMRDLSVKRERDLALAREQLVHTKPDFSPVIAAILAERDRVAEDARLAGLASAVSAPRASSTTVQGSLQMTSPFAAQREGEARADTDSGAADCSETREDGLAAAARVSALVPLAHHPMDTMGDEEYRTSRDRQEQQREMRRLHESSVQTGHFSVLRALWRRVSGKDRGSVAQPLQQDDFARFSYAASPTSIEAVRALRRILLPRSEDYTQVVREEMFEYKREKEQRAEYSTLGS